YNEEELVCSCARAKAVFKCTNYPLEILNDSENFEKSNKLRITRQVIVCSIAKVAKQHLATLLQTSAPMVHLRSCAKCKLGVALIGPNGNIWFASACCCSLVHISMAHHRCWQLIGILLRPRRHYS